MTISRLYLKILLAFVAVLIAAEIIVFGIMFTKKLPPPLFHDALDRAKVITLMVDRELGVSAAPPGILRKRLRPLLRLLAEGFGGQIWVTDARSIIVGTSFDGMPPVLWDNLDSADIKPPPGIEFFLYHNEDFKGVYLESRLQSRDYSGLKVHYLQKFQAPRDELWFLDGLLLLTVLGALFIIPVSRRITRPILQLAKTAELLGQGDLCQRAPERGNDEVAELTRKFNKMADQLQKMFVSGKELTAHVSHELRTPLARMRLSLQILMERFETARNHAVNTQLLAIREEIESMDLLIGRMLDLSKLEMRVPPLMTDCLDISTLLHFKLERLAPMLEQNDLRLITNIPTTPEMLCHAQTINGLLENVLSNAVKYTAPGGTISVTLRFEAGSMQIDICNTHAPLTEEELTAMFEPFHRLEQREETGSGLGLALAKQMAAVHDGTINARNEKSSVCIGIHLPLHCARQACNEEDYRPETS